MRVVITDGGRAAAGYKSATGGDCVALYAMGELHGGELAKLMEWWRDAYKDAYEVFTVGSFGTIRKTPEERQAYLDFHNVPPKLVEQWDAEKVKGVA